MLPYYLDLDRRNGRVAMPATNGFNHIALVTADLDRLIAFYVEIFEADVLVDLDEGHVRHALVDLGGGACLHAFSMPENPHAAGSPDMFGRGHLDHVGIDVADDEQFERLRRRLVESGASDGLATDFGRLRVVGFKDPDGFEAEIALWQKGEPLPYDRAVREAYPGR